MIRRSSRRSSASIPLGLLNDKSLSWKARGLASFILSKPDTWRIDSVALARIGADGRDAVRSGLKELRDARYLVTTRRQNDEGQWLTESVLYEEPETAYPASADPASADPPPETGNPTSGNPTSGKSGDIPSPVDVSSSREEPMAAPQPAVAEVFSAWLSSTGRTTRTVLDSKRRRVIERAIKSYPKEEVMAAVEGWRYSPHHAGQNDTGQIYNEITLLLRDAAHIERFRDLTFNPSVPLVDGAKSNEADDELRAYLNRKSANGDR